MRVATQTAAREAGPRRGHGFSPVMAIGILSVAAGLERWDAPSAILLAVAIVAFASLVLTNLIVAGRSTDAITPAQGDPHLALVLFTWVAACGVLGERMAGVLQPAEFVFAFLAVAGWAVGGWALVLSLGRHRDRWRSWQVTGSWLLAVVATQSLSIIASSLGGRTAGVGLWVLGLLVYGGLILLILRRFLRREVGVEGLTPDYWITMGALAISTVAALDLLGAAGAARQWLVTFAAATLACGALWIPLLVVAEMVRIRRRGVSLSHDMLRWSTVFPLGMFSVASYELAHATALSALVLVAQGFFWAGLALGLMNAASALPTAVAALRRIA